MSIWEKEAQEQAYANALWQRKAETEEDKRLQVKYRRVYSALSQSQDWFDGPTQLVNAEPECRNDPVSVRDCFKVGMHGERLCLWVDHYDELNYWDVVIAKHTCGAYQKLMVLPEVLIPLYRAMFPDAPDAGDTWPWNTISISAA